MVSLVDVGSPDALGRAVRDRRRELGITQDDLAGFSGVGRRLIIEIEAGKPTVRLDKLLVVLHGLGLRLQVAPK